MSFFLVRLEPGPDGNMVDVPIPDYGPYEKGSDAAKEAKKVGDLLGIKVQPRRIHQAPDWRNRQRQRLEQGILKPLPEKWDLPAIEDHFAHVDQIKYPGMILFTESNELGTIDKVTALSPGRYLSRFYPGISDADRRRLIPCIDPSGEVFYAWTPEEITEVYKNGPGSCMDGAHASYFSGLPVWPTSPYGAGDLALAYTKNSHGRIQSRTLCWPEKKQFGRVYGDIERMKQKMIADGYEWLRAEGESWKHFVGARLLKIPHNGGYVLPYFDDIDFVIDGGEFWITAETYPDHHPNKAPTGGTRGFAKAQRWCPKVEEYRDENTFVFVHGVNAEWSQIAVQQHGFECMETGKIWGPIDQFGVMLDDGDTVAKEWFEEHGGTCQMTNKFVRKRDLVEHEGKKVSRCWLRLETDRREREARGDSFKRAGSWDKEYVRDFYRSNPIDYIRDYHTTRWRDEMRNERMVRMEPRAPVQVVDPILGELSIDPTIQNVTITRDVHIADFAEAAMRLDPGVGQQMVERLNQMVQEQILETTVVGDLYVRRHRVA